MTLSLVPQGHLKPDEGWERPDTVHPLEHKDDGQNNPLAWILGHRTGNSDELMLCALYSSETKENWTPTVPALHAYFNYIYPFLFVRVSEGKEEPEISIVPVSGNKMLCQMASERAVIQTHQL